MLCIVHGTYCRYRKKSPTSKHSHFVALQPCKWTRAHTHTIFFQLSLCNAAYNSEVKDVIATVQKKNKTQNHRGR